MPVRDFDAARRERQRERDPIQFVLQGDTYTCVQVVPVGVGLDLLDAPEIGKPGATQALVAFIDQALVDDDRPRFQAALRRRDDAIDPEDVLDIFVWLAEEYAGRPTSPSTESSDGRPPNGRTSSSTADATVSEISAA